MQVSNTHSIYNFSVVRQSDVDFAHEKQISDFIGRRRWMVDDVDVVVSLV